MHLSRKLTRTDAERNWSEFVGWVGFSTLVDALKRKHSSLEEWSAFREMKPRLFSIEIGLQKILTRWRTIRKLSFPSDNSTYDAVSFASLCMEVKRQASEKDAERFRRRVISEILPSGRLCHLDHEFRIAQSLGENNWAIERSGFFGAEGADFVARRNGIKIEVEGKCLSPEIGLGVSYEYAARLMTRICRELRGQYPGHLTKIRIELSGEFHEPSKLEYVRKSVVESYTRKNDFISEELKIYIELRGLHEFLSRFPDVHSDDWLSTTFAALRTRPGDYGYYSRQQNELIFLNLVPSRPNRQMKKVLKLVSETCTRQFSKSCPSALWLHLQGLDPNSISANPEDAPGFMVSVAQHAFSNVDRDHLTAIAFSTDSTVNISRSPEEFNNARIVAAAGKVRGFDNPNCRFGAIPIFSSSIFGHRLLRG